MENRKFLSQTAFYKIQDYYWVYDNVEFPAWTKEQQLWYGWRGTGSNPPPIPVFRGNSYIGYGWRRPTYEEADRRQYEWDHHNTNYGHWHERMIEIYPFLVDIDAITKYRGKQYPLRIVPPTGAVHGLWYE